MGMSCNVEKVMGYELQFVMDANGCDVVMDAMDAMLWCCDVYVGKKGYIGKKGAEACSFALVLDVKSMEVWEGGTSISELLRIAHAKIMGCRGSYWS